MVKCVIKSCKSRSEKDDKASGVTFHKVPTKDQKRREKWIKNIRLLRKETDWLPSTVTVICSKHFKDEDKIQPKNDKGHIRLSDKAVPMIYDETERPIEMEIDSSLETDEEMIEMLETPREHKLRMTIQHLKLVSSRRLKFIKKLRQKNKRLEMKNKQLSGIIKEFQKSEN